MKKIVNLILIIIIACLVILVLSETEKEKNISKKSYNFLSGENNIEKKETIKEYPKEDFEENYKGYSVCAKLNIPVIELDTSVLGKYSTEALNVSVTKFWGVNPNENGNFCIVGHNFKNKNMFSKLKNLNLGDRLFITDKKIGKVEYEIFKIDTVVPEDVNCLTSITKNEKEVTLITCTNDSKKRIIIKAKEVL